MSYEAGRWTSGKQQCSLGGSQMVDHWKVNTYVHKIKKRMNITTQNDIYDFSFIILHILTYEDT